MPLTPQEESQIRKDAEKKYPPFILALGGWGTERDCNEDYREAYISGRTQEREAAKPLVEALEGIFKSPYGCPMCDSGKLRNETKEHWDDCPFGIAIKTLANYNK